MRVDYSKSHDALHRGYDHDHTSYHGDRTVEAITTFAEELLPAWKASDHKDTELAIRQPVETQTVKKIDGPGCSVTGFVLVKKVPGHLWVTATSKSHSFHAESMNMSHVVHHFYFGQQLTPQRKRYLRKVPLQGEGPQGRLARQARGRDVHERRGQRDPRALPADGAHDDQTQRKPRAVQRVRVHAALALARSEKELPRAKFHFDPSPVQIGGQRGEAEVLPLHHHADGHRVPAACTRSWASRTGSCTTPSRRGRRRSSASSAEPRRISGEIHQPCLYMSK